MRAVLGFLLLAALILGLGWVVASWTGRLDLVAGAYHIQMPLPVAVLAAAILFAGLYIVCRLLGLLLSLPRRARRNRAAWRQGQGNKAATNALVALAAADAANARAQAAKARYWLGDTPQTLLLVAQAEHLTGRDDAAAEALRLLAGRPDVGHVGLRGLLRQAIARQDWPRAAELVAESQRAYPNAAWLRQEQAEIALRNGAWRDALRLVGPGVNAAPYGAALAAAASGQTADRREALALGKQAFKADPTLTAAALHYAQELRAVGSQRKAQAVLRQAYAVNPHPAIGEAYLAEEATPLQRLRLAERLVANKADHPESRLLLGRLALQAGLPGEARRHADALQAQGFDQRRLWILFADIAAAGTEAGASALGQEDALRRALAAPPDPVWRCGGCGTEMAAWRPVCPRCHQPGLAVWSAHAVTGETQKIRCDAPGKR